MNEIIAANTNIFIDRNIADRSILQKNDQLQEDQGFGALLQGLLGDVNQLQIDADQATNQLLTGDLENIHQVLIKAEEAQLSLQLTSQVVNKVLQAYQEISRMQI